MRISPQGEVVVFDVNTNRVEGTISDVDRVHGVLAVPDLGRIYATATGSHEVVVIDAHTLKVIAHVPGGTYPDAMAYDPEDRRYDVEQADRNDPTRWRSIWWR